MDCYCLSNSCNLLILSLCIAMQKSLDNLNNSGTIGSEIWTLDLRLKLVGSKMNCVRVIGSFLMFSKFKLFFVNVEIAENSGSILFLITLYAGQSVKM